MSGTKPVDIDQSILVGTVRGVYHYLKSKGYVSNKNINLVLLPLRVYVYEVVIFKYPN